MIINHLLTGMVLEVPPYLPRWVISTNDPCTSIEIPHEESLQLSSVQKPVRDIPLYWLVYRDPYIGLFPYNWVV